MNGKEGATLIRNYFPEITPRQEQMFASLESQYRDWNAKINVISRKDIDNLYVNHVLHSLGIAKVVTLLAGARVLDVGTGGGFPGIPLAILFPEVSFHLVDSIGKKITVVKEISRSLGLGNVTPEQIRAEQVRGRYDFVVSRAVTRMKEFYGWVHQKIDSKSRHALDNGILYLKGGEIEEELNELRRPYSVYDLDKYFAEEYFATKKVVYIPV